MAMTRTAAKNLAAFTEAATRMSQRAITAGLELSQATMNAQAVRAPVQTEQGNAPFLFANVNDQMARFSQAWVQAARGMMAPMTQAPPAAEAAERTSVGEGKGVAGRVDHGGRRVSKKK